MKQLVISVHGIRTFGGWQERLEKLLIAADSDHQLTVVNYKYGYFSTIAFVTVVFRWIVVRDFERFLLDIIKQENWDKIDLVGHSFGTHIIANALYGIAPSQRPKIDNILLAGSVLRPNFPWHLLIGKSVRRLINDCGIYDIILWVNQLLVPFTGMAGWLGFNGGTGRFFRNRFFGVGHSGYFLKAGRSNDLFMQRYWVSVLLTDMEPELIDLRKTSLFWGVLTTLAGNIRPIKLAVWLPILLALIYLPFYISSTIIEKTSRSKNKPQRPTRRGRGS